MRIPIFVISWLMPLLLWSQAKPFFVELPTSSKLGLQFVEVVINKKTYTFLVDTGAPLVLFSNVAREANFDPRKRIRISDTNNNQKKVRYGKLQSLKLGTLEVKNAKALVLDALGPKLNCLGFDGILGSNVLSEFIVQLDAQNGKMILTNQLDKVLADTNVVQFDLDLQGWQQSPYIPIQLEGVSASILLDTGFNGFFSLSRDQAENLQLVKSPITQFSGVGNEGILGNELEVIDFVRLSTLDIGSEVFEQVVVPLDQDNNSKLGMEWAGRHQLVFDFKQSTLYLPTNMDSMPSYRFNSFGFMLAIHKEQIVIGTIEKGSSLARESVQPLTVIRSINGQKIDHEDYCQEWLRLQKLFEEVDVVQIQLEMNGGLQHFTFERNTYPITLQP